MTPAVRRYLHCLVAISGWLVALAFQPGVARASCNFGAVKEQIDNVLDKDSTKAAKFRREVSEGADSTTMMENLVPDDIKERLDECRFQVGEYLTKRGFPPFH